MDAITPRTAKSFVEAQSLASQRLGFSVTQACPLRCRHCSVSADPNLGHTTFTQEFAEQVKAQLPELRQANIKFIDFTGGEPTLAAKFVKTVSQSAREYDIETGIVTAAHWATNKDNAERFVKRFINIDNWDISTDAYHLDFVSSDQVKLAFDTLQKYGKDPLIRIAYHEPMTMEDAHIINEMYQHVGRQIAFQPIGPVGRAVDLITYQPVSIDHWDRNPCPSTGPLVQAFGHVAPCCAPLSHEDYDHPLRLGNAFTEPLIDIISRWRVHPLLQTIRVWGFAPLINWLEESGYDFKPTLRHRACHMCVEMVRNFEIINYVTEKSNEFMHRVKLAYALWNYFGETSLNNMIQHEAKTLLAQMGDP